MSRTACNVGIAGLGTIGASLALNIAEHGYSVAAYDNNEMSLGSLRLAIGGRSVEATNSLDEFYSLLEAPRTVMAFPPAEPRVERHIDALLPHLISGDLLIDAANSYFRDTNARSIMLADKGIEFLGVGISGGEVGARRGSSIMPGGSSTAYERVRHLFQDIAAELNGEPCVAYLGPNSAGHYVRMVHNGIELAVIQLIGETYDLMSRGLGMSNPAIQEVFADWYASEVSSYLLGVLARRLRDNNGGIGATLFDLILDEATPDGGACWASLEAKGLGVSTPTIDVAVAIKMLSSLEEGRTALRNVLSRRPVRYLGKPALLIEQMKRALCAGIVVTFAQGLALLAVASEAYKYYLALEDVTRIWRGSIIRSPILQEICEAYYVQPQLPNLLADSQFAHRVLSRRRDLRAVAELAVKLSIPAPALTASLAYYDDYTRLSPADLQNSGASDDSIVVHQQNAEDTALLGRRLVGRVM